MNLLTASMIESCSDKYVELHKLTDEDVTKANQLHDKIIASRNPNKPMLGDIMICQGPEIEYFSGHIAHSDLTSAAAICVRPYVPFIVNPHVSKHGFSLDTSGGYWFSIPENKLSKVRYIGKRNKLFKAWGHCGPCADGAFTFPCAVNVWSYYSDDIY